MGRIHRSTAQQQLQGGLQGAVVKADVDICAQLLGQQRGLEGRAVGAQQRTQQNLHTQLPLPVGKCAGVPCQCALHLVRLGLVGVVGQLHECAGLLVLHGQAGTGSGLGHLGQVVLIQPCQLIGHVHLAVQGDAAVVGAVMAAVHPLVFLIGQGGDGRRVAAGHKAVSGIREHRPLQGVLQLSIRGGQRTLHLVVDYTADRAVCIPVPALLLEHGRVYHSQRAEHRVQVDIHQVAEIGLVGGGKGIDRFVREGHCVEEGRHAAFEQLHKGGTDRVFFAARQHRVLQNVEHTGVIGREGAEADTESLVDVLVLHQQHGCAADVMGEQGQSTVLLGAVLGAQDGITGIVCHFYSPLRDVFHRGCACGSAAEQAEKAGVGHAQHKEKSNQSEQHADDDIHLVHREREFIVKLFLGVYKVLVAVVQQALFALLKIGLLRLQFSLLAGKFCLAGGQCGLAAFKFGLGVRGGLCHEKSLL